MSKFKDIQTNGAENYESDFYPDYNLTAARVIANPTAYYSFDSKQLKGTVELSKGNWVPIWILAYVVISVTSKYATMWEETPYISKTLIGNDHWKELGFPTFAGQSMAYLIRIRHFDLEFGDNGKAPTKVYIKRSKRH